MWAKVHPTKLKIDILVVNDYTFIMVYSEKTFRDSIIIAVYILGLMLFSRINFFREWSGIDILLNIFLAIAMVEFCVVEARLRNKPLAFGLRFIMFLTYAISVPIYLIWLKRLEGFWNVLFYFLLMIAIGIIAVIFSLLCGGELPR